MLQPWVAEKFFFFFLEKNSMKKRALKCGPFRADHVEGQGWLLEIKQKAKNNGGILEF